MSYNAKVYKVFIASPSDVSVEREVVRSVLARWNAINSERRNIVLLPVGWDTNSAPQSGCAAQDYINEYVLDKCDILIGIFWTKVGSPTKNFEGGSVEEIARHIGDRKLAMLYFSLKPIPPNTDLKQVQKVRKLKEMYQRESLYSEFIDEKDLETKLYSHLEIKINEGKVRSTYDSDILARIKDDDELAAKIKEYFPLVSKNLLFQIVDEAHSDDVWSAIVEKLSKSPADLRDSLIRLAHRGAFKHKVFTKGYLTLAKVSQPDFGNFISDLYGINRYEFFDIYDQNLLEDGPFARTFAKQVEKEERERAGRFATEEDIAGMK